MEPRELTRVGRAKAGGGGGSEDEFFTSASTINRATLAELTSTSPPPASQTVKGLQPLLETRRAGATTGPEEEVDEELGLGRDADASSNADSERWTQPDGLEDQEFSIKEASFSEGSLKLKIQTTKRAKKPPKSLENYICPPEIRITIKQPGEQKAAKQGARSIKNTKEEDRVPPKKKTYERLFKPVDQIDKDMVDVLGEPMKPKHERKPSDMNQGDWTKPPASDIITHVLPEPDSKTEPSCNGRLSQSESVITPSGKLQVKKAMEASCQFTDPQISSTERVSAVTTNDSNVMIHSSMNRERVLHGVTEQVFGNVKRYGRRDAVRTWGGCNSSDMQWSKRVEKNPEPPSQDCVREQYVRGPERPERLSVEPDSATKRVEEESKTLHSPVNQLTDESRGKKRKNRRTQETGGTFNDALMVQVPDRGSRSNQCSEELYKERQTQRSPVRTEASMSVNVCNVDSSPNRQRRNLVGRPRSMLDSREQPERRQSKIKDRWSYLNSPTPPRDSCPVLSIEDPPSAYPITPASPLYTNTDSLTVITPVKKKRGRPKKQPLLTVETIHEGTATSPITQDLLGAKKRKRTNDLSDLVKLALHNPPPSNQLKLKNPNHLGVFKKKSVKKMKLMKMQSILNELFSGSSANNLALKSNAPASSAVSSMASTIEARLGKQINVSKRGTIYIGKKRGRKPRVDLQAQQDEHKDKYSVPVSSQFENLAVPSNPSTATGMPSPRVMLPQSSPGAGGMFYPATSESNQHDLKTMPNLQPISALPAKAPRGLLSSNWKLSPPRLMANSPSHLSEVASIKEVTLSPISESHSEETIPSDSGIGTDNNSTSDQAEKGPASRRRYSFDLCGFEAAEGASHDANGKVTRGHYPKRVSAVAAVEKFLAQESMKKQKHRRKRKGLQRGDDLQFLASLEELVGKFQVFRISHRSYNFYRENSYPSIFRVNFDHYYPMPYLPYDPVHYLRRNSEKSKKRRGRPAKSNEPMMRMPFIQGFGYPMPGGNYYAPYAMPYTSMPLATSMMNMGYFGQYPQPLYLPHGLGAAASPFMRPQIPPPKFHPSTYPKLATLARHRAKSMPHTLTPKGIGETQSAYVALKGGNSSLASVCLHKRKHKHKHKHKDDQYSVSETEDLGGLFSGTNNSAFRSRLNDRMEKDTSFAKAREKQRTQPSAESLTKKSRNFFEADPLSTLTLSGTQHCRRVHGEGPDSFRNTCGGRQPLELSRARQDGSLDLFTHQQRACDEATGVLGLRSQRHSFPGYRTFTEGNPMPFQNPRQEGTKRLFHDPNPMMAEANSSVKRRYKRKEIEEIQSEVRKMRAFSKMLSTKKNMGHVNKILRVKRLQRQSKTGNNIVKLRRGRPRKYPLPQEEEDEEEGEEEDEEGEDEEGEELASQMPVLEKCVDLPGKRQSTLQHAALPPEPLEFSNHDSIMDAIESVVHKARQQPKPHLLPPAQAGVAMSQQWQRVPLNQAFCSERLRRCRGAGRKEDAPAAFH